jgi:hypothetical protein
MSVVVAWHELTHQKPTFLVVVGGTIRDQPRRATRSLRHPHGHPLVFGGKLKRAVKSVASLIISSAQSAAARYFVTGTSSHNALKWTGV